MYFFTHIYDLISVVKSSHVIFVIMIRQIDFHLAQSIVDGWIGELYYCSTSDLVTLVLAGFALTREVKHYQGRDIQLKSGIPFVCIVAILT